jgi:hypothetical protein
VPPGLEALDDDVDPAVLESVRQARQAVLDQPDDPGLLGKLGIGLLSITFPETTIHEC